MKLSTRNHDRGIAGLNYVYPVISRRSGGVSVGINLNPNNACNWHCVYCQVPNLRRGSAPRIDLQLLAMELQQFLQELLGGSFMKESVPDGFRRLSDIAISGNGEPTSSSQFEEVVEIIERVMDEFSLKGRIRLILITNGSYMRQPHVMAGIRRIGRCGGEVWIKVDRVRAEDIQRINGVSLKPRQLKGAILAAAQLCPTWIQTCMHRWKGRPPAEEEMIAYLAFLKELMAEHIPLEGVLLYGLARPSMQQEAEDISPLSESWMREFARRIRNLGCPVILSL
jgi:wyosine [tRNA(Phe)-imidazoG37] synthetase (radical SAM superfamily)